MAGRLLLSALLCASLWSAPREARISKKTAAAAQSFLDRISANTMRANLSFLASDALEGRATPSPGLEVAAEFIASRYRLMGLEPIPGTSSYFQVANWRYRQVPVERATGSMTLGDRKVIIDPVNLSVSGLRGVQAADLPVFKATVDSTDKLKSMADGALSGSAVLLETVAFDKLRRMSGSDRSELLRKYSALYHALDRLKPAALIGIRPQSRRGAGAVAHLIDPKAENEQPEPRSNVHFHIHSPGVTSIFEALSEGATEARISLSIPDAIEQPTALKNVVGILPGSDPALKDSYVIVTAHYDHVGRGGELDGDSIYNGANDDGSGTVSLLEVANAMTAARPKRTLVFIALFGEEKGLLGSYYYTRHPIFPLENTVADLNLEHMGRTDDNEGPEVARFSMTGFDYSDMRATFESAGKATGVDFHKREKQSDAFFNRSDNAAFAEAGIPAHTFTVAYEFPDYHGLGDHWDKIDYDNMAKVSRALALGVSEIANRPSPPAWNTSNEKTEKYRTARAEGNKSVQ